MSRVEKIKRFFTHESLREVAITLHYYNIVEITIISIFTYLAIDLLTWYKEIMTPEQFNGPAFWGAIMGIVAAIFGASKHMNETFKNK